MINLWILVCNCLYRAFYLFCSSTIEKQGVVAQKMEDIEMEEDRDSIKCGNESSHGAMQLGERHRDASNREHSPILSFDKGRETPEAGFEFFAPLRSFREGTTQGEQPRPEPFKQMVLLSDQEEYDDYDSVQSQQSLSSVKEPGRGRDFLVNASF